MKRRFDIQAHEVIAKIVELQPTAYTFQLPDFFPYVTENDRVAVSDLAVRNMFLDRYTSAAVFCVAEDYATALLVAVSKLIRQWEAFKALHYADFAKVINAEADEYDMLYNYDKTIRGSVTHNPDYAADGETAKGYHKQTALLHGHTVTITDGKYEESVKTAPYDGSPIETTTTERGHQVKNGVTDHNTQANTGTDTTTETEAKTQDYTDVREFGNIGVQTIPDMLVKEIQLRSESMVQAYLDCFVRENLITTWIGEGCF